MVVHPGADLKAGFLGLGILKYGYDIASNLLWPQWLGGTPRTWEFFLLKVQPGDLKKLSDWAANSESWFPRWHPPPSGTDLASLPRKRWPQTLR